jgi:uncharacterized membrane protein
MNKDSSVTTLQKLIESLVETSKDLKHELTRFGVVSIIGLAIVLLIGGFYHEWYVPISALVVFVIINLPVVITVYKLLKLSEQNRSNAQEYSRLKENLEDDFKQKKERLIEDEYQKAREAFDVLVHSKKDLIKITPKVAGIWVLGWKNLLVKRGIKGFWLKMPDHLGESLNAIYELDGPVLPRS